MTRTANKAVLYFKKARIFHGENKNVPPRSETAAGLFLSTLCAWGAAHVLPFAMEPGQTASSWLGDQYVGSDGQHYYSPAPYTYLVYNSDGTMDVRTSSGGSAYRHYADCFRWKQPSGLLLREAGFPTISLITRIHQKAGQTNT